MSVAQRATQLRIPEAVRDIVIGPRRLEARVAEMAHQINSDYPGEEICAVGVLNGALPFLCDLVRRVTIPVSIDFVAVSRYRSGQPAAGVRLTQKLQDDIRGRHVLLVDCLLDTGLSLDFVVRRLQGCSPASLFICTLLSRPELRLAELPVRYLGFEVGEEFLIGYGLDFQGYFRELPYIASMRRGWVEEEAEALLDRMSA